MGAGGEPGDPAAGAGRDANVGRAAGGGEGGGGSGVSARRIAAIKPRVISLRSPRGAGRTSG